MPPERGITLEESDDGALAITMTARLLLSFLSLSQKDGNVLEGVGCFTGLLAAVWHKGNSQSWLLFFFLFFLFLLRELKKTTLFP